MWALPTLQVTPGVSLASLAPVVLQAVASGGSPLPQLIRAQKVGAIRLPGRERGGWEGTSWPGVVGKLLEIS